MFAFLGALLPLSGKGRDLFMWVEWESEPTPDLSKENSWFSSPTFSQAPPASSRGGVRWLEESCCTGKEEPEGASVMKHHLVGETRAGRALLIRQPLPFPGRSHGLGAARAPGAPGL